jgi:hypothetical protein
MFDEQGLLNDWANTVITLNVRLLRIRLLRVYTSAAAQR